MAHDGLGNGLSPGDSASPYVRYLRHPWRTFPEEQLVSLAKPIPLFVHYSDRGIVHI
jgi:hypothetical protein